LKSRRHTQQTFHSKSAFGISVMCVSLEHLSLLSVVQSLAHPMLAPPSPVVSSRSHFLPPSLSPRSRSTRFFNLFTSFPPNLNQLPDTYTTPYAIFDKRSLVVATLSQGSTTGAVRLTEAIQKTGCVQVQRLIKFIHVLLTIVYFTH